MRLFFFWLHLLVSKMSGFVKHFLDVRNHCVWTVLRLDELHDLALSINEELRIVPWDLADGTGLAIVILLFLGKERILPEVDINWVGVLAIDVDLLGYPELGPVLITGELLDSRLVQWLLFKRVTWEHKNFQPLRTVLFIDLN